MYKNFSVEPGNLCLEFSILYTTSLVPKLTVIIAYFAAGSLGHCYLGLCKISCHSHEFQNGGTLKIWEDPRDILWFHCEVAVPKTNPVLWVIPYGNCQSKGKRGVWISNFLVNNGSRLLWDIIQWHTVSFKLVYIRAKLLSIYTVLLMRISVKRTSLALEQPHAAAIPFRSRAQEEGTSALCTI